jgi:nucleotide-binding universal stress UspA family protein
MKTIIALTDYSGSGRNATRYAAGLAKAAGDATLVLYHSYFMPRPVSEVQVGLPSEEDLAAEHQSKLDAIGRDLSLTYGVKVESIASPVPVTDGLPGLVKKRRADLVVLGMGRVSDFDRRVFGSTATTLIREAAFPLLVVPQAFAYQPPDQILFACDYKALSAGARLSLLQEIAAAFEAKVQVLHVEKSATRPAGEVRENHKAPDLESLLQGLRHEYLFLEGEDPVAGIERGIREQHTNLLVMVPRQHDFWDILFNRSTTRQMAFQTPVPLLVLPDIQPK